MNINVQTSNKKFSNSEKDPTSSRVMIEAKKPCICLACRFLLTRSTQPATRRDRCSNRTRPSSD